MQHIQLKTLVGKMSFTQLYANIIDFFTPTISDVLIDFLIIQTKVNSSLIFRDAGNLI